MALIAAVLAARAVPAPHRISRPDSHELLELAGAVLAALLLAALPAHSPAELIPVLVLFLAVTAGLCFFVQRLSMPGILRTATQVSALVVGTNWAYLFLLEAGLPDWLTAVSLAGLAVSVVLGGLALVADFARDAVVTHDVWRLPVAPSRVPPSGRTRVSLHLCCYAEPPEIVKATMNRLAALDYPDFEVLVCDNNTPDEALWRPLETHCAALNRRLGREVFRFFHVSPLPGAKAGALNFLLEQMDPAAELIGVIDADYLSRPDFLSRLVPFFDDPALGYIQTPHDYFGHEGSDYLSACYWEYMPTNKVDYAGISEYGGAFTIGTMCVLRAEALRRAGGWAEWCLTEDSEVSVRIRAAGYRGLYFVETFGRGLIPETFEDYKKQRFRWTAGPVQQLRRHWRLFLPAPFAPALPGWSKLLEVARCVTPLQRLAGLAFALAGFAMMGVALARGDMQPLDLPDVVWWLMAIGTATFAVRTVHRYRLSGCTDPRAMIRGEIARASLAWVVLVAGIAGLSRRPLAWRRTPKFALEGAAPSPFASTMVETVAGMGCLAAAAAVVILSGLWGAEVAAMMALGLGTAAVSLLCAPLMAAMAIAHAAARRPADAPQGHEVGALTA
jgi:glycosyltransferase involved in cell wall biosynthesis